MLPVDRRASAGGWLRAASLLVLASLLLAAAGTGRSQGVEALRSWEMRVCAAPDALPFSERSGAGFENRIAQLLADELGARLDYVWVPRARDHVRTMLLHEGDCDLVMGVVSGAPGLLTSLAYYRSGYLFVSRRDRALELRSLDDPALRDFRIGVQVGGGGVGAGSQALAERGLIDHQVGFAPDPGRSEGLAVLVEAVAAEQVDVAIVWGPVAGFFAERQPVPLDLVPVEPQIGVPFLPLVASVAIGVRPGDDALRDRLDVALAERWNEIQAILADYRVPLLPLPTPVPTGP